MRWKLIIPTMVSKYIINKAQLNNLVNETETLLPALPYDRLNYASVESSAKGRNIFGMETSVKISLSIR